MYIKTTGVILSCINSKETDRIYRIYTKEYGKLICIGKGVRNIKSRRTTQLDTLNLVDLGLNKKDEYYYIDSVNLLNNFKRIKQNLTVVSWSLYLIESLTLLTEEQDIFLYNQLVSSLLELEAKPSKRIVYTFLRELILKQGYWDYEYENNYPFLKVLGSNLPPTQIEQAQVDSFFNSLLEKLSEKRINSLLLLKSL